MTSKPAAINPPLTMRSIFQRTGTYTVRIRDGKIEVAVY